MDTDKFFLIFYCVNIRLKCGIGFHLHLNTEAVNTQRKPQLQWTVVAKKTQSGYMYLYVELSSGFKKHSID